MMPLVSTESSPGHRVMLATCDVCGKRASFGYGVNLRAAMNGNKAAQGKHYCREHKPAEATP